MIIKAACTACTKPMIVEDYEIGQTVNCPYCGNVFVPPPPKNRPAPTAPPPPGPPKAGMPIVSAKGPDPAPAPVQARPSAPPPQHHVPVAPQARPSGASGRQPAPPGLSGRHQGAVPVVEAQVVQPPPSATRLSSSRTAPVPVVEAQVVAPGGHVPVAHPQPSLKRKRKSQGAGIDGVSGLLFGIAVILLLMLACSPFMTWLKGSVTANSKSGQEKVFTSYTLSGGGTINMNRERVKGDLRVPNIVSIPPSADGMRTEAVLLLVMTLVIVFLGLVALLCQIYGPAGQPWPGQIFGAGLALLAAWSLVGFLWMIGDIWKVQTVKSEMSTLLETNISDRLFSDQEKGGEIKGEAGVGLGLWLGLLSSLVAVVLLLFLGIRRSKLLWVGIAQGVGLLIGLVIMFTVIQPTKSEGGFMGANGPADVAPKKGY